MKILSSSICTSSFFLKAPAKINWFLKVLNKRTDGYHNIISLMQCIGIFDILRFEHADNIEIISDLNISQENNLVYKAVSILSQHIPHKKGIKITLKKNIPISAGLGGGSSDAAYTLLGLNKLWELGIEHEDLCKIGLSIGSDVPFFLGNAPAIVEGRGEKITNLNFQFPLTKLLLVKPPINISTVWAYSLLDKRKLTELTKKHLDIKLFCHSLIKKDFVSLSTMLDNDLEKVVSKEYPIIEKIKKRMLENGAIISSMTGSGPTVFGVFKSKKAAFSAAHKMGKHYWSRVTETIV